MPSDSERKVIMTDEEMMEMVDMYRIARNEQGRFSKKDRERLKELKP